MSKCLEATFVIIGGGIAGVSCLERLKDLCPEESVILITASSLVKSVTNVFKISSTLCTFDVAEKTSESLESCYDNLKVIKGAVTSIDHEKHVIHLENSTCETVTYKKVILCHGARPNILTNDKYVFGIRDTQSVMNFQEGLKGAKKIAVIGNGGIATEMVHELKNIEIVWIIKDSSINATFVDPGASQFFVDEMLKQQNNDDGNPPATKRSKYTGQEFLDASKRSDIFGEALGPDWHSGLNIQGCISEKSVTIEKNAEVEEIKENPTDQEFKLLIRLTNGKVIACDLVVSATGVIPNGDQIKVKGLDLDANKAIAINDNMETSVKDVFSAGDVCSCEKWTHSRLWLQMRLWTQARLMGLYSGECMLNSLRNRSVKLDLDFSFEMFSHVTKFFGFKVILLGLFNGQGLDPKDYEVLLRVTKGHEYVKVVVQDGKMLGALLIGETELEETFENLILNQLDISSYGEDLLHPDVDIQDYFD